MQSSTEVIVHDSVSAFLAATEALLMADEALNSLQFGIANGLAAGRLYGEGEPLLLSLRRDGITVGAAVQTPPWNLLLSQLDTAACDALLDWVIARGHAVPGVKAEDAVARYFATSLAARTGIGARVLQRTRLFELHGVIAPPAPGGVMRVATRDDRELVASWYDAFRDEATPDAPTRLPPDYQLAAGKIRLWIDAAGRPVSLAGRNREQPTGASIGPVYTPPPLRGRGYATALVAALSQSILDEGKRYVCLFTNLANPVSNAIYPRVGYRPIADMTEWTFGSQR